MQIESFLNSSVIIPFAMGEYKTNLDGIFSRIHKELVGRAENLMSQNSFTLQEFNKLDFEYRALLDEVRMNDSNILPTLQEDYVRLIPELRIKARAEIYSQAVNLRQIVGSLISPLDFILQGGFQN